MKAVFELETWQVNLTGEIDVFNAMQVKEELTALFQQQPGNLKLDCSGLQYLDSTGLGMLVSVYKRMREAAPDAVLTIYGLAPHILKVFTLTGLDKLFVLEVAS